MEENKVKSLSKAMSVLECFLCSKTELGITEISQKLQVQKATIYNIAATFQNLGYLVQNPETKKYSLSVKLLQYAYIINNHLGFRNFFLPYMDQIVNETNENVYLGIPHGSEVLYIEFRSPAGKLMRNILGEHAPMYCTGLGKAMLAFLPEVEIEEYASLPLAKFTETTITEKKILLQELSAIRKRGYAIDNMEHEHGVICIGMPVFGNDGRVLAALSSAAPSLRFDHRTIVKNIGIMRRILAPVQNVLDMPPIIVRSPLSKKAI